MVSDESKCVNCHRCVALCPTRALKIVKTDHTFKENANWTGEAISEVYRQAEGGGVLLSSMGNPNPFPIYWDKILINASQVTNPSIDPLREPMETKVFLGKKPDRIERDENGKLVNNLAPQLELAIPIMFSAMTYGSISYNAHASLARAAQELGTYYNTGEGGLHEDFYQYGTQHHRAGRIGPVRRAQGLSGGGRGDRNQDGAGREAGHRRASSRARRSVGDISKTRMIPGGIGRDLPRSAPRHLLDRGSAPAGLFAERSDRIQKAGYCQNRGGS